MREKLTLTEFEEIKKQLKDLQNRYWEEYEEKKALLDFNEEEFDQLFSKEYLKLQERLLAYDLSEIPFDAWKDLEIFSDSTHIADFSNTNANIDLEQTVIYDANLKGCNIRNFDKYRGNYNSLIVDDKVKKEAGLDLISLASSELQTKFYNRNLEIDDVINNIELFENIRIENFLKNGDYKELAETLGDKNLIKAIKQHPDFIKNIDSLRNIYKFTNILKMTNNSNLEERIKKAVKVYCLNHVRLEIVANNPSFLTSFDFKIIPEIKTIDDIMKYDENTFVLDKKANEIIEIFGINNIKRFEQDTKVFSNYHLDMFYYFFTNHSEMQDNFKDGSLSYLEFQEAFAKLLEEMKSRSIFTDYPNYDFITGSFRDNHPELFLDINAPKELKKAFYQNRITCELLNKNKDFIPFLVDKNIEGVMEYMIEYYIRGNYDIKENLITLYANNFGNKECLEFLAKYGELLDLSLHELTPNSLNNKELLEKEVRKNIVLKIKNSTCFYSYLENVLEFKNEYPELFIDLSSLNDINEEEKETIKNAYYSRNLSPSLIQKYPELINILKDKDLSIPFASNITFEYSSIKSKTEILDNILKYYITNQDFLTLCFEYGKYLTDNLYTLIANYKRSSYDRLTIEEIRPQLENIIARECSLGNVNYSFEDAPHFLKEKYPELFLDENVPEIIKQYFYNFGNNYHLTFDRLSKEKDWLPYLKGKSVSTALLRGCRSNQKSEMLKYFQLFGEQDALKLGIRKSETVEEMIRTGKVALMKEWYDKTGHKFIPDFVVMKNFPIEEADKFLISGSLWSNLMKIKSFAQSPESRDAVLKLAYSFGVFEQDQRAFKKLQDLLTYVPKKIDGEHTYMFEQIDNEIDLYSQRRVFFDVPHRRYRDSEGNIVTSEFSSNTNTEEAYQKMIEYVKSNRFVNLLDTQTLLGLLESLKEENVGIDFSKNIFTQIYRKNEDGSYSLTINPQSFPKTTQSIRSILERFNSYSFLTPLKAHQLFSNFELKYDADFRDFLLTNMDTVLSNSEKASLISNIQRQFSDIKAVNSNRVLTWELAVSYVKTNKYTSVEIGNERVAEISSIAGYSQSDFNTLQQIYNYGKQRAFSSIPRIENKTSEYTYEILRLDDPLAMAIGTLTDCCQELGNVAEMCMEHSMTSNDGRVFVIKDNEGNIIAQSWVWRNKDVLCFDNIEIPNKAFTRAKQANKTREEFTKEVYDIYKKAASELIEADKKVYQILLDSGKITREQYEGLRLGKITVGLGYNDIADTLQKEATKDLETPQFPLDYQPPVDLGSSLYINDSRKQYILEERKNRINYEGETLAVHNDTYIEYTDSNFTLKHLLSLEKLEIKTKGKMSYLETNINKENDTNLVTKLAINYDLNPKTTKVILHPNFAIIYDINDNILKIGDLLFNTELENNENIESKVVLQIKLALDQISKNMQIDISNLDDNQKDIYEKAQNLNKDSNQERGGLSAR